jgi:F-type H+-transporting ATPase subunit b
MDQTLKALGGILLNALPTLFLVLFLHFYLKRVFFRPLERVLDRRRQATEGARQAAEDGRKAAERKAAEYEAAIRDARSEIYKEQDKLRRSLRDEQAANVAQAREKAGSMLDEARAQLAADADAARWTLDSESEALSELITERILSRSSRA